MSHLPTMHATIDRRVLVNYRIDPEVAARALPAPFRPRLVDGVAIGGICLIRLTDLRPRWAPARLALTTENAAHRFAVEFGPDGHGVFVPRRDTDSAITTLLGGRLFPGAHHRAEIRADEHGASHRIALTSRDGRVHVAIDGTEVDDPPPGSIFGTVDRARAFFRHDPLGYSTTTRSGRFDCMELDARQWDLVPLAVESVASSMFDDPRAFPPGTVEFDSAFVMRGIDADWRPHARLRAA